MDSTNRNVPEPLVSHERSERDNVLPRNHNHLGVRKQGAESRDIRGGRADKFQYDELQTICSRTCPRRLTMRRSKWPTFHIRIPAVLPASGSNWMSDVPSLLHSTVVHLACRQRVEPVQPKSRNTGILWNAFLISAGNIDAKAGIPPGWWQQHQKWCGLCNRRHRCKWPEGAAIFPGTASANRSLLDQPMKYFSLLFKKHRGGKIWVKIISSGWLVQLRLIAMIISPLPLLGSPPGYRNCSQSFFWNFYRMPSRVYLTRFPQEFLLRFL